LLFITVRILKLKIKMMLIISVKLGHHSSGK
jgi:hypothetical protein